MIRAVVISALVVLASIAHADDKPWAAGVDASAQKKALDLYNAGNQLFDDEAYAKALELYTDALAKWDHPKIHYNAAICLKKMDRLVEAYEQLVAALKYGAAPFTPDVYKQALALQAELEGKIGSLEVKSKQEGAQISIDGKVVLRQPGAAQMHLLAGQPHQLVAAKPHYETQTRTLTLEPGQETTLVIELKLLPAAKQLARRWPKWQPWAVLSGGAAIAGAGGLFAWRATVQYGEYDRGVAASVTNEMGQPPVVAHSAIAAKTRGDRDRTIAYSAFAAGGLVAAAGLTMLLFNQGHLVAVPLAGKESAGVSLAGSF